MCFGNSATQLHSGQSIVVATDDAVQKLIVLDSLSAQYRNKVDSTKEHTTNNMPTDIHRKIGYIQT